MRTRVVWLVLSALVATIATMGGQAYASRGQTVLSTSSGARVDPAPAVTVDTNARGGTGIEITGPTAQTSAFYPGAPDKWLHVLVLNRRDLHLVSNTSYDCRDATARPRPADVRFLESCIDRVKAALTKLEDRGHTNLVIATSQYDGRSADQEPPNGVFQALAPALKISSWNWWASFDPVLRGTFTAIGVPGLGGATERVAPQRQTGAGAIVDNLVRDNEGNYGLVSGERETFSTEARGSDDGTNVIRIGDHSFDEHISRRSTWVQLVIVDSRTLEGRSYLFDEGDDSADPGFIDWSRVADVLHSANREGSAPFSAPKLVFFVTHGLTADTSVRQGAALARAADELAADGATRTDAIHALWEGGGPRAYTLVGATGLGAGRGQQRFGKIPQSSPQTMPIAGVLARTGGYYNYRLQTADALTQTASRDLFDGTSQLLKTAGLRQSAWPEQGHPQETAAIEYLGEKVLDTPDPRTQYWSIPWTTGSPHTWETIAAEIGKQPYPSTTRFDEVAFKWAKQELEQEITWLIDEHTYLEQRARPFERSSLSSWADLTKIAARIDGEVEAPDRRAEVQAGAIVDFAFDLGEEVPIVGKAIAATAAIYRFATEYGKFDGESIEHPFAVKAAEVGGELVDRMNAAEGYLSDELPKLISSDYSRLQIVGSCGSPLASRRAACPFAPSDWQYTPDDQKESARALQDSSQIAVYGALLPARYEAWALPVSTHQTANTAFAGRAGLACFYPFEREPSTGQVAVPQNADHSDRPYQVTALGFLKGTGKIGDRFEMVVPRASVTDHLFGTRSGDLDANKEGFFDRFFHPRTGLHYPEDTTPTGWDLALC